MVDITNWRQYFRSHILVRGEIYYEEGRVENLTDEFGAIEAEVFGSDIYDVSVYRAANGRLLMDCDCPHALDGNHCKHMAAVLYAYENEYGGRKASAAKKTKTKPKKPEIVKGSDLFPDTETRKKLFYNMHQIAGDLTFKKEDVAAAQKLVEEKALKITNFKQQYSWQYKNASKYAYVTATFRERDSNYQLQMTFNQNCIQQCSCSHCYTSYDSYWGYGRQSISSYCVHEIALLMVVDDYLYRLNPGDSTDAAGSRLLKLAKQSDQKAKQETLEKKKNIILEPRIVLDMEGLSLSFKIGVTKTYVVKNLSKLCADVESGEVMTLGKKQSVSFLEETFTEESQAMFDFLKTSVHDLELLERKIRDRLYYMPGEVSVKNNIPLDGKALDAFYDLMFGKRVAFQNKLKPTAEKMLLFADRKMQAKLHIFPNMEGNLNEIVVACDLPPLFDGETAKYSYDGACISRLHPEDASLFQSLEDALEYGGQDFFTIGEKHFREFYYRILPGLQESDAISVKEELSELVHSQLPPDYAFRFYLDVQNGIPICRGEVAYDEQVHPLKRMKWADLPLEDYRDFNKEQDMCDLMQQHFPEYDGKTNTFFYDGMEDQLIPAMQEAVKALTDEGEVHATDAFDRLKVRKMPVVKVGVSIESDLMDLSISSTELSLEELIEILNSYKQKKKYHRLRDGRFIGLENDETLDSLMAMFDAMQISVKDFTKGKLHLPVYRALYLEKMLEEHESLAASRDRQFKKILRDFGNIKDADVEMPASLAETLRNYQVYGVQWIHLLKQNGFGGILADDMGLGKTLQVIAALLVEKLAAADQTETVQEAVQTTAPAADTAANQTGRKALATSLIVCPASLVYNWLEEIRRFAPSLSAAAVAGTKAERLSLLSQAGAYDVLITSYDLLKRDVDAYENLQFLWQVIDEAQYIKNPKTSGAKSVKIISAKHKLALTGTPIENRLSELWSIFDYLMPGFLYNYSQFQKQFENPIVKFKDKQAEERLRKMIAPFVLRRLKQEVLKDLPEKLEEIRYSVFDEKQQQLYDAQVAHMKAALDSEVDVVTDKIAILAELTKIRQICCDPALLVDHYTGESAKRQACVDLIESAIDGGHKILVFSQFTSMLALLEESLKENDISYYLLTGSTPKEERIRLMREFNTGDIPVFLISLKAGGTGLNLTGADVVIHYDPWWNLAAQNQATDRAHRIGQDKIVSVYKLIAKGTIEEKIVKLQEEKKDLADAILTGEHTSLASLSKDELYDLLQ